MRTIEIDDDVYRFLLSNATEIGESASSILRRVLGLPSAHGPGGTQPNTATAQADRDLLALVEGARFKGYGSVKDKYLGILSFVAQQKPQDFEEPVRRIGGRNRRYFAETAQEIAATGRSTQPRQIPGTQYWALTNSPTRQKRQILDRVLGVMGYERATVERCRRMVSL